MDGITAQTAARGLVMLCVCDIVTTTALVRAAIPPDAAGPAGDSLMIVGELQGGERTPANPPRARHPRASVRPGTLIMSVKCVRNARSEARGGHAGRTARDRNW